MVFQAPMPQPSAADVTSQPGTMRGAGSGGHHRRRTGVLVAIIVAVALVASGAGVTVWWFTRPAPLGPVLTDAQFESFLQSDALSDALEYVEMHEVDYNMTPTSTEPACQPYVTWYFEQAERSAMTYASTSAGYATFLLASRPWLDPAAEVGACLEAEGAEPVKAELKGKAWYWEDAEGFNADYSQTILLYGNLRIDFQMGGVTPEDTLRKLEAAIDEAAR